MRYCLHSDFWSLPMSDQLNLYDAEHDAKRKKRREALLD
jgi:hypothetical protein